MVLLVRRLLQWVKNRNPDLATLINRYNNLLPHIPVAHFRVEPSALEQRFMSTIAPEAGLLPINRLFGGVSNEQEHLPFNPIVDRRQLPDRPDIVPLEGLINLELSEEERAHFLNSMSSLAGVMGEVVQPVIEALNPLLETFTFEMLNLSNSAEEQRLIQELHAEQEQTQRTSMGFQEEFDHGIPHVSTIDLDDLERELEDVEYREGHTRAEEVEEFLNRESYVLEAQSHLNKITQKLPTKIRRCWMCDRTMSFRECQQANKKLTVKKVMKIWEHTKVRIACCGCTELLGNITHPKNTLKEVIVHKRTYQKYIVNEDRFVDYKGDITGIDLIFKTKKKTIIRRIQGPSENTIKTSMSKDQFNKLLENKILDLPIELK